MVTDIVVSIVSFRLLYETPMARPCQWQTERVIRVL